MDLNKVRIQFAFGGQRYTVGVEAAELDAVIKLPDGTLVDTHGWLESDPPQPAHLFVISEGEVGDRPVVEASAV